MRNVVLVTIDSLRADHCGYVTDAHPAMEPPAGAEGTGSLTPTLDAMAETGTAFTTAIAPGPSTPESMPAVFTGSHPTAGVDDDESLLRRRRARIRRHMRARRTIAERFRDRGYATAGFSPNPYTARYFGFDAGFDRFEDFVGGSRERLYEGVLDGPIAGTALSTLFPARVLLNWLGGEEVFKPWTAFYADVREWIAGTDGPYFCWVLLMDTHDPYLAPDDYRSQSRLAAYRANWRLWRCGHEPPAADRTNERLRRAYRDVVRFADAFLTRLRGDLPRDDEPLVCVHGDHGEAFGEHGTWGHHQRLYEENLRVPLVVGGGPNHTVERPVDLAVLPRLLVDLAAGETPSLPAGPARSRTLPGGRRVLRGRDWKYRLDPDGVTLYDLAADPGERDGETAPDGDLATACDRLLASWRGDDAERRRIAAGADHAADGSEGRR